MEPQEDFSLLGCLVEDEDPSIHKVVDWVLKEISKTAPEEMVGFLNRWKETTLSLAELIFYQREDLVPLQFIYPSQVGEFDEEDEPHHLSAQPLH